MLKAVAPVLLAALALCATPPAADADGFTTLACHRVSFVTGGPVGQTSVLVCPPRS
jgi:hypothetical protein